MELAKPSPVYAAISATDGLALAMAMTAARIEPLDVIAVVSHEELLWAIYLDRDKMAVIAKIPAMAHAEDAVSNELSQILDMAPGSVVAKPQ